MKFLIVILASVLCSNVYAQYKSISISNPSDFERKDELIVLSRNFLETKLGHIPNGKFIHIFYKNVPKVLQHDDLDRDGTWDEIVFLQDFSAKEKIVLNLQTANNPATVKAVVRAYVRHKHNLKNTLGENLQKDTMPYNNQPTDFSKQKLALFLTEGPAWENDKVGFRKYFDVRNANDIWGKTTSDMVLDHVGTDPAKSYHQLDNWGMDILKVGKSLGAGALALRIKQNGRDSLIRFGKNAEVTYERISNGPVRAIFQLVYKNWKYLPNADPISVTERISIWGGQYFFQNEISLSDNNAGLQITTGTIDFYTDKTTNIFTESYAALCTHGKQSENKDTLGLGIITPVKHFGSFGFASSGNDEIANSFTVNMHTIYPKKYIYRYYAAWAKTDEKFNSKKYFESFMRKEGEKFTTKLLIE